MRGDALLSAAVTRQLISEFVARPPDALAAAGMERLTNREREVVALVAYGLSNDEIAAAMVLSPTTAKTHVSRAMIKLGARDRAQLVVFAYQTGLVSPRDPGPPRQPPADAPWPRSRTSPAAPRRDRSPVERTSDSTYFVAVTVWMMTAYKACQCGEWSPALVTSRVARALVRALPRRLPASVGHSNAENWSVRTRRPPGARTRAHSVSPCC